MSMFKKKLIFLAYALPLLALGGMQRGHMCDVTLWRETYPLDYSSCTSAVKVFDEQTLLHGVDLRRKTHLQARDDFLHMCVVKMSQASLASRVARLDQVHQISHLCCESGALQGWTKTTTFSLANLLLR